MEKRLKQPGVEEREVHMLMDAALKRAHDQAAGILPVPKQVVSDAEVHRRIDEALRDAERKTRRTVSP
jgi:hypothetical protein